MASVTVDRLDRLSGWGDCLTAGEATTLLNDLQRVEDDSCEVPATDDALSVDASE